MPRPLKTFIIYARKDESFKNDLLLHLKGTLISTGHLHVWQDNEIQPGEEWEKKIEQYIAASDLFLVLLSIHSLTSDFIQKKELVRALEKKSVIVPILVRNCLWQNNSVFAGLQGLPKNMKPVNAFTDHDDAWTEVMAGLHEMVEVIRSKEERKPIDGQRHLKQINRPQKVQEIAVQNKPVESKPEMIFVKGGKFQMGDEYNHLLSDCKPVHLVTVSDFEIGKYPVTQKIWTTFMRSNPSRFKGADLPVETISWDDCQIFLKMLNEKTGKKYRLPTEAEWEFAARGGTLSNNYKYAGSNDLNDVGWFWENSGARKLSGIYKAERVIQNNCQTQLVGRKKPNELGIHDMSGNVWEWCHDWYGKYSSLAQNNPYGPEAGSFRVYRGGSWSYDARNCGVANRFSYAPTYRYSDLGFRLALSV